MWRSKKKRIEELELEIEEKNKSIDCLTEKLVGCWKRQTEQFLQMNEEGYKIIKKETPGRGLCWYIQYVFEDMIRERFLMECWNSVLNTDEINVLNGKEALIVTIPSVCSSTDSFVIVKSTNARYVI